MDDLENFHFEGSSDDNSSDAGSDSDDDSTGDSLEKENLRELDSYRRGETEWYRLLGKFLGMNPSLKHLVFESLDPDEEVLSEFWFGFLGWNEVTPNKALRSVKCVKMDLRSPGNFLLWFQTKKVKSVSFQLCKIGSMVGHVLANEKIDIDIGNVEYHHRGMSNIEREIVFDECSFPELKNRQSIIDFSAGLAKIRGLTSLMFRHCLFRDQKVQRLLELVIEEDLPKNRVDVKFYL